MLPRVSADSDTLWTWLLRETLNPHLFRLPDDTAVCEIKKKEIWTWVLEDFTSLTLV